MRSLLDLLHYHALLPLMETNKVKRGNVTKEAIGSENCSRLLRVLFNHRFVHVFTFAIGLFTRVLLLTPTKMLSPPIHILGHH